MSEFSLTVDDDGMTVTNLSDGLPSCLHVLTIPADNTEYINIRTSNDNEQLLPSVQLADIWAVLSEGLSQHDNIIAAIVQLW